MTLQTFKCNQFTRNTGLAPLVLALMAAFTFCDKASAQIPLDLGVTVTSTGTPTANLVWSANKYQTGTTNYVSAQKLFRRVKGTTTWGGTITLSTTANTYSDTTLTAGTQYEYFLEQDLSAAQNFSGNADGPPRLGLSSGNTQAFGYICAGINLPRVDNRGTLLLLVDNTMSTPLATEISQLQQDLAGDGWNVVRTDLPRQTISATATLTGTIGTARLAELQSVKDVIKTAYLADPAHVKQVFILGHLPVPYSGYYAPDGHDPQHTGAWPADTYYADMTGSWTDTSTGTTSGLVDARNTNVKGDGKFDQTDMPFNGIVLGSPQLQVGRVDLWNMTQAPSTAVSETELLRRYLNKDHQYRFKLGPYANIQQRALAQEWWGYLYGAPEVLETTNNAILGRNLAANPNIDYYSGTTWSQYCITHPTNTYLFGYCEGAGGFTSCQGGGSSTDIGSKPSPVVFTGMFGSFFGDWDSQDNYMRSFLAGNAAGDSLGLTCFWSSRPGWITYPLAMGATWGEVCQTSEAATLANYPVLGTAAELSYGPFVHGVWMGLLGDPALRLYQVQPPQNVIAQSSGGTVQLSWDATTEPAASVLGYLVFRSTSATGPFTALTSTPISATNYTDSTATAGTSYTYMVKTLKLQNPNGGTFQNESQGSPATITASSGATSVASTPTNVQASVASSTQINLTWTASAGSPTGYIVQRAIGTGTFTTIATSSGSTTNYTDVGPLTAGTVFYYQVIATNAIGNSAPSSIVSVQGKVGVVGFTAFSQLSSPITYVPLSPASSPPEADIVIQRQGGNMGAIGVSYATANGSAVAGVNYTATTGTLTWAEGDNTSKTIHVPLMPSPQEPGSFYLTLSNPTGGAVIQGATKTVALIEDSSIPLRSPWASAIFGPPTDPGYEVELVNGEIADSSNGSNSLPDLTGRLTYQPVTGDMIMTAHVEATTPGPTGNTYPDEAGIAVHSGLSATDTLGVIQMTSKGVRFLSDQQQYAAPIDRTVTPLNSITGAYWLRMIRSTGTLTGQMSPDNVNWTTVGTIDLGGPNTFPLKANWGVWHQTGYPGDYQMARFNNIAFSYQPDGTVGNLAIWNFITLPGTEDNVQVMAANPRLTLGNLARALTGTARYVGASAVVNLIGSTPTGHVYATTQAGADAAGQYYQFTFTPKSGTHATLSDLDFTPYFQNLTGTLCQTGLAYSTDGFASTNNSVTVTGTGSYGGAAITPYKADLSSISVFQDMSAATTVTFRVYLYGLSGYSGYSETGLANVIVNGKLALSLPPTITTQPLDQTVLKGQGATFTVVASGSPTPTYQWTKNGANIGGATSSTYSISSAALTDTGTYAVIVTNVDGSTPSANAVLNVSPTTPFSAWASNYFGTDTVNGASTATPQNDGASNLLKYFSNINPTQPMSAADRAALPTGDISDPINGTQYLTLTYRQSAVQTGVVLEIQTSSDAQTWTTVNNPTVLNTTTDTDPVITVGVPISGATQLYIRMKLTLTSASTAVATTGYGYKTLNLPATGLQSVTSYVSIPLTNPPTYSSGVATVSGSSTLTVAGTPWTSGQFAAAGSPYFLKFTTGLQSGRSLLITANTGNSVTVDITDQSSQSTGLDAAGFAVQPNDSFEIIAGETLSSFLGDGSTNNPVLLKKAANAFTAETVSIYQPTLSRSLSYYFNSNTNVWTCSTVAGSQNNLTLYPGTVLCVTRRSGDAALGILNTGNLPDVAPLTKTVGSSGNIFASTRYPVDMTLANLSFTGWVKGTSAFNTDAIAVWDQPTARFYSYYQLPDTVVNGTVVPGQWRRSGDTVSDYSSFLLPGGTGFQITKRASVSGASSYLLLPLPAHTAP